MKCQYCHTNHSDPHADTLCTEQLLQRSSFIGGYRYYFHDPHHPLAKDVKSLRGMVDLSRHLVSVRHGKWLEPQQIVHFENGDAKDLSADNLSIGHKRGNSPSVVRKCVVCGNKYEVPFSHTSRRFTCSDVCGYKRQERFQTDPDQLLVSVWEQSVLELSHEMKVSDKAIEKRCKKYGVPKPPRGYWAMLTQGSYTHERALLTLGWKKEQIEELNVRLEEAEKHLQKRV